MPASVATAHLKDAWDEKPAAALAENPLALLRYRSNLLGADLRITNFGGGNTSSKFDLPDPFTGAPMRVLAVKGSGGDLGSIQESGFAVLYLERIEQLKALYRGEAHEDEMVQYYPLAAFGANRVAASIDTPLHAFLPFAHVDHLHPDSAIAIAASANGKQKLSEFNQSFGRKIVWLPWQRPGFELALMLEGAVRENPGCDGILLGSHGLFTWGDTQRDCYLNSIRTIDQMSEFIRAHEARHRGVVFGGSVCAPRPDRKTIAARILPALRGVISSNRRVIAHYADSEDALAFAGSRWARELAALGTSCPDHFLRTRICPMFVNWDPAAQTLDDLKASFGGHAEAYQRDYAKYYSDWATPESPRLRDSNPSVVIIPGLGIFGFGKNKKEARITTEFFTNAIHVMAGATALESGDVLGTVPQARTLEQSSRFTTFHNYVALPRSEAFRIEYWVLEEAKLQRMPPEAEFSRKVAVVVGAGSGIGREIALLLARKGAHVVVADRNGDAAQYVAREVASVSSHDAVTHVAVDIGSADSIADAALHTCLQFGGIDIVISTAGIYPVAPDGGSLSCEQWQQAFLVNVTGHDLLVRQMEWVLRDQNLPACIVLTSSANAVVPKHGSEAYDVSKAALNHLIRELAVGLAPVARVNGIAPATVVSGSTMFPRDRVIASLQKYKIEFSPDESTEQLRDKLAAFYAQRTLTGKSIHPRDCANAILWLAGDESAKTTGHIIPVDGGLQDAFLR